MSMGHVPDGVSTFKPTKLDFSGKAVTQSNVNKKLSRQRERKEAEQRIVRKMKSADFHLANGSTYDKNELLSEKHKDLPINLEELDKMNKPEPLDAAVIKSILPKGIGKHNAEAVTKMINQAVEGMDNVLGEHFRDNCVNWTRAIQGIDKLRADQYINAVKFVTHKLAGSSNTDAYRRTFPDRVNRMILDGMTNEYLNTYAGIYAKGKIVTEIYALALIPTHIMYQDYFHLAVKTQVEIMTDPRVSPKVRSDAASSLMTHLKQPEIKKAELDITVRETDTIAELRNVMQQLASQQNQLIIDGECKVIDVSHQRILEQSDED